MARIQLTETGSNQLPPARAFTKTCKSHPCSLGKSTLDHLSCLTAYCSHGCCSASVMLMPCSLLLTGENAKDVRSPAKLQTSTWHTWQQKHWNSMEFHEFPLCHSLLVEFTKLRYSRCTVKTLPRKSQHSSPGSYYPARNDGTLTTQVAQVKVTVTRNLKHPGISWKRAHRNDAAKTIWRVFYVSVLAHSPQAATNIAGLGLRGWRALTKKFASLTWHPFILRQRAKIKLQLGLYPVHRWMIKPHWI